MPLAMPDIMFEAFPCCSLRAASQTVITGFGRTAPEDVEVDTAIRTFLDKHRRAPWPPTGEKGIAD